MVDTESTPTMESSATTATNTNGCTAEDQTENPSTTSQESVISTMDNGGVPSKTRIWATPWVIMLVALYAFAVPWVIYAILMRYFLKPEWNAALPGLDRTIWHKVTMGGHMACGAIAMLLGPIQFIPYFRRPFFAIVHRWSGRLYCTCAMLSSLLGLSFIALKGELVGGWNMTVAFSAAGATIGVLGFKVWQTARAAKASAPRDFTSHRNWGIRSYSQILAPMLYRYWYLCLYIFKLYDPPDRLNMGLVCGSDDVCPDYLRFLDKLHCWTYWMTSLAVAELIIYYLPEHETKPSISHGPVDESGETPSPDTPLLQLSDGEADTQVRSMDRSSTSPSTVNTIGWVLATIIVIITANIFT